MSDTNIKDTKKSTTTKDKSLKTTTDTTVKKVSKTSSKPTKTKEKKTTKEKKENTIIPDTKKYIINNKITLLITLLAFPFGFLFTIQNRKSYHLAIIFFITTILSMILYFTLYNFLYYYS